MTATTAPAIPQDSAMDWIRKNLFKNWYSGLLTLVLIPIMSYVIYKAALFVFVNGQWDAVRVNLTLFMQGTFPRAEQWRLISQLILFALAFGIGAGTNTASRHDAAEDAGLTIEDVTFGDTLKRMWSLVFFIAVLLFFASTDDVGNFINPYLVVAGALGAFFIGYQMKRLPRGLRNAGWLLMVVVLIFGFQIVSGIDAGAWVPLGLVFGLVAYTTVPVDRIGAGWLRFLAKLAAGVVVALIVRFLYSFVDLEGVGWDSWSGLHLTLMVSAIAIVLSFPLGLLLALARRSTLPALRWIATTYIEIIRGVPLITLLFMGQFILGFLLPAGTDLSGITRAIAAMTLFTAAYVAEIVRGGLQALPAGQNEAGQALGLAPPSIMQRIILPQALRSVIPAMVGQFISLFKDSSLLTIIGILEFLGVREIIHAQADFRGTAIAETLVFVAFGYWAFAFAMSRESQRLERRLRVTR
jgi:general L-amino acid transport system permease protein